MEIKKNYFPRSKAPENVRKRVMKYVYAGNKSLTKRFYFYKVYAPAFALLFIFILGFAFYRREISLPAEIKRNEGIDIENVSNKSLDHSFEEHSDIDDQISPGENYSEDSLDPMANAGGNDLATKTVLAPNQDNQNVVNNIDAPSIESMPDERENITPSIPRALSIDSDQNDYMIAEKVAGATAKNTINLESEIAEIEKLLNDISSIADEEDAMF